MVIKQEAINRILEVLRKELVVCDNGLQHNARQINMLADAQRVLKKEKTEICKAIRILSAQSKKESKS